MNTIKATNRVNNCLQNLAIFLKNGLETPNLSKWAYIYVCGSAKHKESVRISKASESLFPSVILNERKFHEIPPQELIYKPKFKKQQQGIQTNREGRTNIIGPVHHVHTNIYVATKFQKELVPTLKTI